MLFSLSFFFHPTRSWSNFPQKIYIEGLRHFLYPGSNLGLTPVRVEGSMSCPFSSLSTRPYLFPPSCTHKTWCCLKTLQAKLTTISVRCYDTQILWTKPNGVDWSNREPRVLLSNINTRSGGRLEYCDICKLLVYVAYQGRCVSLTLPRHFILSTSLSSPYTYPHFGGDLSPNTPLWTLPYMIRPSAHLHIYSHISCLPDDHS